MGDHLPRIGSRVGVDSEPLDLSDPATAGWLAACVPPEAGAVTRFAAAAAVARAHPVPTVRGDLVDVLPRIVAGIPRDELVLVDTYVHVFLPAELARFSALVDRIGRERDVEWISVDPLVRWARTRPRPCRAFRCRRSGSPTTATAGCSA